MALPVTRTSGVHTFFSMSMTQNVLMAGGSPVSSAHRSRLLRQGPLPLACCVHFCYSGPNFYAYSGLDVPCFVCAGIPAQLCCYFHSPAYVQTEPAIRAEAAVTCCDAMPCRGVPGASPRSPSFVLRPALPSDDRARACFTRSRQAGLRRATHKGHERGEAAPGRCPTQQRQDSAYPVARLCPDIGRPATPGAAAAQPPPRRPLLLPPCASA